MRYGISKLILSVAITAPAVTPLLSQTLPGQKPSFEVASVKSNRSGAAQLKMTPEGDRFIANNVTLWLLLQFAFRPPDGGQAQIFGVPNWGDTDALTYKRRLKATVAQFHGSRCS